MVKRTLPVVLMLFSALGNAEPTTIKLLPRVCLGPLDEPCELQFTLSWQSEISLCLYQNDDPTPLLCGHHFNNHRFTFSLQGDTRFIVKSAEANSPVQSFLIKHLAAKSAQQLDRRRVRWSLF